MKRETTPPIVTDKILVLCYKVLPDVYPEYIAVETQEWCQPRECFPNVQRMVQKQGGQQINGWAIWQWSNIMVEAEAHAVWKNQEKKLLDITPHDNGERQILFLRDDRMVYSGNTIPSIRLALTSSPLVDELIELMNERDRIMCNYSGSTYSISTDLWGHIIQIQTILHTKVGRNDLCPCQSGLKYKKCCGR